MEAIQENCAQHLEKRAMTPNELLLWLSARKQGSWPQFRGAVERLDLMESEDAGHDTALPLHQRVRLNLERLGHVEFDVAGCEDGWRVVPPTFAVFQNETGCTGVYCGARTPSLLGMIGQPNRMQAERVAQADCPDIIRLHKAEDLAGFAAQCGMAVQLDCAAALLSCLPRVDTVKDWREEQLPASGKDWDVKQFVVKGRSMRWYETTVQEANAPGAQGLFCFTRYQMPRYFLRQPSKTVSLPGAVGKYVVLSQRQRRVLRYDRRARTLTLPAILRPPMLTERGLVLCSGFPPSVSLVYKRRMLTYRNIPEEVAGMAAEILRQDFL
jgi:hypothetical protein